jgi:hypothetical protein
MHVGRTPSSADSLDRTDRIARFGRTFDGNSGMKRITPLTTARIKHTKPKAIKRISSTDPSIRILLAPLEHETNLAAQLSISART